MKEMGLKLFMVPFMYADNSLHISLKVKRGEIVEYFSYYYFNKNSDGRIVWRGRDIQIGASNGIFAYLNDDNAVNFFFLSISNKFAQSYMDKKIKS